jgi:predicted SprT family Zn-dependent metalloprotease
VITLSRAFVERNAERTVRDTILHEAAHALAWEHDRVTGHGPAWKQWCAVTGAKPRRCFDEEEVTMPAARYQCTVLAREAAWSRGSGANLQTGVARIRRGKGEVFGRHRLTRKLRWAVGVGLVAVFDRRVGRLVGR